MGHGILDIGGVVPAAFANKHAWHGLGTIFDEGGTEGMTSDQALELSALNGEFTQEGLVSAKDGTEMPGQFGVYYNHPKLGMRVGVSVVGSRYKVVQPSQCFGITDRLVKEGLMKYESAFALQGYQKVCMLARLPKVDVFAEGDEGHRYIAISNDYTGEECLEALPTSVRVVCQNTKSLAWSIGKRLVCSVRHTGDIDEKLEEMHKYLSQFNEKFTDFRDQARILATRKFSKEAAQAYINTLFPIPVDADGKPLKEGRKVTSRENKLAEIRQTFKSPAQQLPSIQGSWWALFNAVTDALDHPARKFKGTNDRVRNENRYISVMNGPIADMKDIAFDLACKMAGLAVAA